jgi:hypothetical protein
VIVRDDESGFVDDEAGAHRNRLARNVELLSVLTVLVEEIAERLGDILHVHAGCGIDLLFDRDCHNRGTDALDEVGETERRSSLQHVRRH